MHRVWPPSQLVGILRPNQALKRAMSLNAAPVGPPVYPLPFGKNSSRWSATSRVEFGVEQLHLPSPER
jgi:hypothetical protein